MENLGWYMTHTKLKYQSKEKKCTENKAEIIPIIGRKFEEK
jgi:hypothetical protein